MDRVGLKGDGKWDLYSASFSWRAFISTNDFSDEKSEESRRKRAALFTKLSKNAFEHAVIRLQKENVRFAKDAFKRFTLRVYFCTEIKYAQLGIILSRHSSGSTTT